jgi:hypothetical protein
MKLTTSQIGIALTSLGTAILHLLAAFDQKLFDLGPDPLFILNAIGYIGLLGAYLLPIPFFQQYHKYVRWALMAFAVITILAWVWIWVINYVIIGGVPFFSHDSLYGVPAKICELLLLYFLSKDKPAA